MGEKKFVPKKRFERFKDNESWQEIRLGENAIIKGRLGWKSLKREEYIDYGPRMIAGKHINNGIINWNEVDHIPLWRYEESPEIMLKNGDVIFSKDGSLGNPALITDLKGKATINATMMLVRTNKNLNPSYFYQILNSKQFLDLVYLKVSGSSIPHLFQEDMKNFKFYAPPVNEQQKIGEFFKVVDERIANQELKITKVKALKSAYLTEMFPQEGETVPKRRFKGYTNNWRVSTLGEIYNKIRNAFVGTATPYYVDKGHFYLQSNNVKNGKINKESKVFINNEFYLKQKNNWLRTGDIVMVQSGHVGHTAVIEDELDKTAAHALIMLQDNKVKIDPYFLNDQFQTQKTKEKLKGITTGNTIKHILASDIKEFNVYLTSLKEQQKIGEFFKNLEEQITTEERKLEKLKKMKEAYLEEMFV